MPTKLHTIDPDGDLLLQLIVPDEPDPELDVHVLDEADPLTSSDEHFFTSFTKGSEENNSLDETSTEEIHFLVSSRHLMLASPVFKAMLRPNFKEGSILQSTGKLELDLPDDDPTAFKIILDVIHGQMKEVPRKLDIHTLAIVVTLADKYQMVGSIEFCLELLWMPVLKESRPKAYNAELVPWLSVAWICRLPEDFKHLTCLAVREGFGGLSNEPLPIPESITEAIEEQREQGAVELFSVLQDQIGRLIGPETVCQNDDIGRVSFGRYQNPAVGNNADNCDAMTLGSLLKSANDLGLYPPPSWPYKDSTLKDLISRLRKLNAVSLCDTTNNRDTGELAHGVVDLLIHRVILISSRLDGLDLDKFR